MTQFWIGLLVVPLPTIAFMLLSRMGDRRRAALISALVTLVCAAGLYFLESKLISALIMVSMAAIATGLAAKAEPEEKTKRQTAGELARAAKRRADA